MEKWLLILLLPFAFGTIINADSCSLDDVRTSISEAVPGDTVNIPSGECTWEGTLNINKGINLVGSGIGATKITGSGSKLISVNLNGGDLRISSIEMSGQVSGSAMSIDGIFDSLRVDHMSFNAVSDKAVWIGYNTWFTDAPAIEGVFDHIEFYTTQCSYFMMLYGKDNSWKQPDDMGSIHSIFIEDGYFEWDVDNPIVTCNLLDGEHGARFTIRNNTIVNGGIKIHDTGSTQQARGSRKYEYYGNKFLCNANDCGWGAVSLRGGTGTIFDNLIYIYPGGHENPSVSQIYRVGQTGGSPWRNQCDGVPDLICSNFRSHCSGGDHRPCGVMGDECNGIGECVDSCSTDDDCPVGESCIIMDGQLEPNGYPCRDQTGMGMDDPMTHMQEPSPVYWWNNVDQRGNQLSIYIADANLHYIKEGRDYFNIQKPGYEPFTYPHPLAGVCVPLQLSELISFIDSWRLGTKNINEVMQSIKLWKSGC